MHVGFELDELETGHVLMPISFFKFLVALSVANQEKGGTLSWVMGHGSWVMGHGSWVMGHGSWVMGHGSWVI